MASLLTTARFFTTVAKLAQLPREGTPEVAFVGRSNAGKSSAINALCQRRRLAFASKTPGRTQALNFFALGPESEAPRAFVVDTPGYGYASAPEEVKRSWDQLAGRYLAVRDALRGVVLVVDVRRQLTALDRQLLGFLRPETPLLVLLTKSDKLGTAQLREAMRGVERGLQEMGLPNAATLISFSSTERVGLDEVRELVDGWLADADAPAEGASSG